MEENEMPKSDIAKSEEEILRFWKENNIFEKSLKKKSPKGDFVFYDGPPFATGLPHYGHVLPGTIKDAIPRYKTMRGYHVRRKWGWDCHGLPIENLIEQELNLKTKKDIEKFGIDKFNARAQESVLRYSDDWRKIVPRTGRWVDMERDYRTMDWTYTESVWWIFKTLYDKGLIYEGFKSMHLCPRCETTLSNFEVNQGYKEVTDISVTAKLPLTDDPDTFLLVWTTTPWTLPGNVAAVVNKDFEYVKIRIINPEVDRDEKYILAKERLSIIKNEYEIIEEFVGDELVGKEYKPLFEYYADKEDVSRNKRNWKVYSADFVNIEEGTGVVHVAPAFGEDDMSLGKREGLSFLQHVTIDGKFKDEIDDFRGMYVKPKENPQKTDIEIIKHLAHKNLLFSKEKITHTYPHCWRCDTPLLNYASHSWFVKVTAMKDALLKANKKIEWLPRDIKEGRFGKGLESAPDWAISRSRYWGAPLPVWRDTKTGDILVIGSLSELKAHVSRSGNRYFIMRHGEAVLNTKNILNATLSTKNPLTPKGKSETKQAAQKLSSSNIDFIIYSPLERTRETAQLVARMLNVDQRRVVEDPRLREITFGEFEGKTVDEYHSFFKDVRERFTKLPSGGETWTDVKNRVGEVLYELEHAHKNKNILIVSHGSPLRLIQAVAFGLNALECAEANEYNFNTAEFREIDFVPLPHNDNFELDFHRPYIDRIELVGKEGQKLTRVPDVFDCWFESGAMPYGQHHYPFENLDTFNPPKNKGFPAHFISEGLDQTRGWFYSLLVLGVGLFGKSPYDNVVVSGLVLGEDGHKMSKKLKNYPDILYTLNKYGADTLRYYLLSSPLVRAETLNFSEKGMREIQNKIITRLRNVCSFYEMYTDDKLRSADYDPRSSANILDKWILVRLAELVNKVTYGFEHYELDKATKPVATFIDDLSTWYIRRSRARFKSDDKEDQINAFNTTRYVLLELSKIIAPCMPFIAEEIYQKVKCAKDCESVHLENWPKKKTKIPVWPNPMALLHRLFGTHDDFKVLGEMQTVRDIVTLALEARTQAGIKVRQPLNELRIKNGSTPLTTGNELGVRNNDELISLIKDEVNVKEVVFGAEIESDVELDTTITAELKNEGNLREFIRHIQGLRKKEGLLPSQYVILSIRANDEGEKFVQKFEDEIKKGTSTEGIEFIEGIDGEGIIIDDLLFKITINLVSSK